MAWHGIGMPQIRPKRRKVEEEHAVWTGISGGVLTLGLFLLEKREGPLPSLLLLHTKSQRGSTTATTPLAARKTRRVQRYSCRQNPAKKRKKSLLMSLFFWGDRRQAAGLLDVVPRTTSEEAAVCKRRRIGPGIKDGWWRKENSVSKEGSYIIGVSQCL